MSRVLFGVFISCCMLSCATPQKFTKKWPEDLSQFTQEKKLAMVSEFEIRDWSGLDGINFYVGGKSADHLYTLESFKPIIEQITPTLREDLKDVVSFHQTGKYILYGSGGFFTMAAAGYFTEAEDLYHHSQSLGLLSLFLWVIFEQFEWQIKDQIQFQYNDALRENLGITWEKDIDLGIAPATSEKTFTLTIKL